MSRRKVLVASAAAGSGALALSLAGCGSGGGSDSAGNKEQSSALAYKPKDTTSSARPGGTLKDYLTTDVVSFDPLSSSSFNSQSSVAYMTYPRLLKFVTEKYPNKAKGAATGDLAESYELSDDKLQLTLKLRDRVNWEHRAPTNGRQIDAEDVAFSWNKFARVSPYRGDLAYSTKNAGAPVESVSTPDSRTVVFKMHQPDASIIQLFATAILFFVMPRESDGGFDPKGEVRGYGPYVLEEYRPSSLHVWKRNPDYYVKDRPFIDRVERPIIPEYATRLSQFKAGNVWTTLVRQEDVISTKNDIKDLLLTQGDEYARTPTFLAFGYEGDSPFKDERMRQAISMLADRELFVDVIGNRDQFASQGLELPVRYNTVVGAGWDGYWLDPLDRKKFGSSVSTLEYNVAEAKKLMSAAGFPDGIDTDLFYNGGSQYGSTYTKIADIYTAMFSDGGIRAKQQPKDYQSDYLPNYYYAYATGDRPGFNGIIYGAERGYPTVASQLFATMHKDGPRFHGMTPNGNKAAEGDPQVNDMVDKIRVEFDLEKQQKLVQDFIRYVTAKAYNIPFPFAALSYGLYWPVIGNLQVYDTYAGGNAVTETALHWWIDDRKPPLSRS